MNQKQLLKKYRIEGYYNLEFRGVTNADEPLLQALHALFRRMEDAADWRDIRSFDQEVGALIPEHGYLFGGGAHHLFIHAADEWGQLKRPSFKIKISHDVQGFYKHVAA